MPTIRLEKATKFFKWEGRTHAAVDEASLQVEQGEFVFLVGSSGAGKSTLLKLVTGELKPDQGVVYLNEMNLARVPAWRRHRVYLTFGQVWQEPMLIRKRTVYENLAVGRPYRPAPHEAAHPESAGGGRHAQCGRPVPGRTLHWREPAGGIGPGFDQQPAHTDLR